MFYPVLLNASLGSIHVSLLQKLVNFLKWGPIWIGHIICASFLLAPGLSHHKFVQSQAATLLYTVFATLITDGSSGAEYTKIVLACCIYVHIKMFL